MPIRFNFVVDNIKGLERHIKYVQDLSKMKSDRKFKKFIQEKCLETVRKITEQRLVGGTTDDEMIQEYKSRHKIREFSDGFVLYNDTTLPASMLSTNHPEDYPNGFSIALAFEYGIGIVGQNNPVANAWEYNLRDYNFGWYYQKYDESYHTYGYSGFEIYRYTAVEIEKQLPKWVNEYMKKKEV